jgi:hypothetical protein
MQMRRLRRLWLAWLACGIARLALGEPLPHATPRGLSPDILRALEDVGRRYGADAVSIEGFLMGHAIENGSVLETSVRVVGIEERADKTYLVFALDTGIVYNDRELNAAGRLGRTWSRIVERTLRRFRRVDVPADGIGFLITYAHKPYRDEAELRAHLSESAGEAEHASFYLLRADVADLTSNRITGQDLADKAAVFIDGSPQRVHAEAATSVPEETQ